MKFHDYKKLSVWQKSMNLVEEIYRLTSKFPKEETYGLTSQMRRAAISIPSNIAEGSKRKTGKDFCHFLILALGSAVELETQLLLAVRLQFCTSVDGLESSVQEIIKMLNGLINSVPDSK